MPRYELVEGTSNKFWEITLEDSSFTTVWGRIGTAGQSTKKSFDGPAKAKLEHDKLLAEKVKKGYREVGSTAAPVAEPPTPRPAAPVAPAPELTPVPAPSSPAPSSPAPSSPAPSPDARPPTPGAVVIHWSDALSDEAARETAAVSGGPKGKRTDGVAAFAELCRIFAGPPKDAVQNGLVRAKILHEPVKRLVRVYTGARGSEAFDAEAEGLALLLLPQALRSTRALKLEPERLLVASWVARGGLVGALEAFVHSLAPVAAEAHYHEPPAVWLMAQPKRALASHLPAGVDRELRGFLAAATPTERAAAKARAAELREAAPLVVRSGLAALFGEEAEAWIRQDLEARVETGERLLVSSALLYAAPPATLARFFEGMDLDEATFLCPAQYAYVAAHSGVFEPFARAYLARHREAALAPLGAWLTRAAELYDPKAWTTRGLLRALAELFAALRCVENAREVTRAAIAVLQQLSGEKLSKDEDPRPAAIDCVCRSPEVSLPVLREAAKARATWARELLPRVERLAGGGAPVARASEDELPLPLRAATRWKAPAFWTPDAFSPPTLANGKALTPAAIDALAALLAKSEGQGDALTAVKQACSRESLAAFAWDLFQAWLSAGAPSKEKWAFLALAELGDDATARKLTPLVRAWPGESQHARAVVGLDVLAGIGSDVAMMMLHGIAQRVKFKGLQERAREKMDEIAARRGLTAEELADRLVPDLDLEDDGSKVLDFGPRSFRVGFDETLSPFVTDASGARLKDLPKPNQKDDAELAATAVESWKVMKKDAKALAALQILRLELAMGNARRWRAQDFETFLVHHPLLGHLVRRLVWGTFDGDALTATFRVAEDRSYADRADEAFSLAADARVGVVHRLQLSHEDAAAWSTVFRDYALAQPFEQLTREVFRLTPEELVGDALYRFDDRRVETKRVMALLTRGWRKGSAHDNGHVPYFYKPIAKGLDAGLQISGINVSSMEYTDAVQELGFIDFGDGEPAWGSVRAGAVPLAAIDPIVMSEVLRDVESLGQLPDDEP
jgi:predicted DNA-binding WGR domain protein